MNESEYLKKLIREIRRQSDRSRIGGQPPVPNPMSFLRYSFLHFTLNRGVNNFERSIHASLIRSFTPQPTAPMRGRNPEMAKGTGSCDVLAQHHRTVTT